MVDVRGNMSISPVCSARKRCPALSGTKRTFSLSPRIADAKERHMSLSNPR